MDRQELSTTANELDLWAENEVGFYRWFEQVNANMARKWVKNVYSLDLAIKAYRYPIDAAAKQYALEYGSMTDRWSNLFSVSDRNQLAEFHALWFVSIVRQPEIWNDLGEQAAKILRKATTTR